MENKKVLLGMSGGVDSTAAAILLQEQGYEVVGATMELWGEGATPSSLASTDAKKVCDFLGISHYVLDFREEFKKRVIDDFINEYEEAKTPNPCVQCNKFLKFGLMYKKAKELGCEYIATGHYARTEYNEKYSQHVIRKAASEKKDQSYVLYNIPKNIVSKVLFPLGNFESKEEIREIVRGKGLDVANKQDSQEICFIPDNDYGKFLIEELGYKPKQGSIVKLNGEVVGKHNGLIYYTIGQRKGLRNFSSYTFVCCENR